MVAKKKATKPIKKEEAAPMSLEESIKEEERKPAVTQVVEVVEDEAPLEESVTTVAEAPAAQAPQAPLEEESSSVDTSEESLSEEDPSVDEKRKELVDELFQKKSSPVAPVAPEISMHTKKPTKPAWLWAIGMITMCLVVGGALLLFSGKVGSLPAIVVVPTPTSTPTPEATPTPTQAALDRASLKIQVLNGGGTPGAATKMKKALEDKGYTVTDTGNASSYTYDETEILVKKDKEAYIALLEEDLKGSYTLGASAATVEDDEPYDAQVIVGKE
jgi:hypothetical protein